MLLDLEPILLAANFAILAESLEGTLPYSYPLFIFFFAFEASLTSFPCFLFFLKKKSWFFLHCLQENGASTILRDIARARENIQKSLAGVSTQALSPAGYLQPFLAVMHLTELGCDHFIDCVASDFEVRGED